MEKKNIYALIVGINKYKKTGMDLNGCLDDLHKVEAYLDSLEATSEVHIKKLTDAEATYANIIKAFREHLCLAGANDIVFFHFSGHGSQEPLATAFRKHNLVSSEKGQTLVCYDSDAGAEHLADKELAVLLEEVATQFPAGGANGKTKSLTNPPHIIVALDCCHSGSGTRDFGENATIKTRNVKAKEGQPRVLESYIDGYYANLLKETGTLSIPAAPHVLLSACDSSEKAGDTVSGGIFTLSMYQTLNEASKPVSYADLFLRTRAVARRKARVNKKVQTPQFQPVGNFNPNALFLDSTPAGRITTYTVEKDQDAGNWRVRCGAVHGIPAGAKEPIHVIIRDKDGKTIRDEHGTELVASIAKVGAQLSSLSFANYDDATFSLDENTFYQGEVLFFAAPKIVRLTGDASHYDKLLERWNGGGASEIKNGLSSRNLHFITTNELDPSHDVEATAGGFVIRESGGGRVVHRETIDAGASGDSAMAKLVDQTIYALDKIANWERMVELKNPVSKLANMFDFEVEYFEWGGEPVSKGVTRGPEIKIYAHEGNTYNDEATGVRTMAFSPRVHLHMEHMKKPLFAYLFRMNDDYSIQCKEGVVALALNPSDTKNAQLQALVTDNPRHFFGWGIRPEEGETSLYLKLVVTTEKLDSYAHLEQQGLETSRDFAAFGAPSLSDEWDVRTVKITVVWQENEIRPDEALTLNENLTIRPNKGIQAKVNLVGAMADSRSLDPAHRLAMFDTDKVRMMSLGTGRSLEAQNVLEMTYKAGTVLAEPLEIELPAVKPNEMVLPIAFDGKDFIVIGDSMDENGETEILDGKTIVKVRSLPEMVGKDRSLTEALKMAFFRLVLDRSGDQINKLRWVAFKEDGSIERHADGVDDKIAGASNILLLLHGIIGDTEGIALATGQAKDAQGKAFKDHYDLVLTYDYENLYERIENTARRLHVCLEEAGLGPEDGKKLTLMAHSMGGLVSRWFIEKEGGHNMVDHLIQLGTPNSGSRFGKIEEYHDFARVTLNFAANFFADFIPFAGRFVQAFQATDKILVTLGQMNPDDKDHTFVDAKNFLDALNKDVTDPGVPYTILAGDISQYDVEGGGIKALMEKVKHGLGNKVYSSEPNDIAVSCESIESVPHAETIRIKCHHMNYFTDPQSLSVIGGLLPNAAERTGVE